MNLSVITLTKMDFHRAGFKVVLQETMPMPNNKRPSVYSITNTINGKRYVGSAVSLGSRFANHRHALRKQQHHAPGLQADWVRYGADAFAFDVLEVVADKEHLRQREQFWIDHYQAADSAYGYNVNPSADGWLGRHHTEAAKKKIAAKAIGRKLSAEHIRKLVAATSGPMPEERRLARRGQGNPNAKLTDDDVRAIKKCLGMGVKVAPLAREFSVTYQTIWQIKRGIKWAHVE
jgi:group I intron endonuclease